MCRCTCKVTCASLMPAKAVASEKEPTVPLLTSVLAAELMAVAREALVTAVRAPGNHQAAGGSKQEPGLGLGLGLGLG